MSVNASIDNQSAAQAKESQINNKLINEEYKIWKKQSPFLYDFCCVRAMATPSLTVQWFPSVSPYLQELADRTTYTLLLGSFCLNTDEPDYFYQARVSVPHSNASIVGGFKGIEATKVFPHPREPNIARYCYHNTNIVATKGYNSHVYVFDTSAPNAGFESPDGISAPEILPNPQPALTLEYDLNSDNNSFALSWSRQTPYQLASGTTKGRVVLWDVEHQCTNSSLSSKGLEPSHVFEVSVPAQINSVEYSKLNEKLLAAASEDGYVYLLDPRSRKPSGTLQPNTGSENLNAVNGVDFNPKNANLLASANGDGSVFIWDLRVNKGELHVLEGHSADVSVVKWSPHNESVLASASNDRRINVWDLALHDLPQSYQEEQEGPPELLFIHGGHTSNIADFDWHPTMDWTIASTAEDNVVQIWKIAEAIVDKDLSEIDNKEDDE